MKIESITVREIRMKLKRPFETSFGTIQDRRILLVEVKSDGLSGWGEVTAGERPFYNPETCDTAWHILRDFIVPLVLGRTIRNASEAANLMRPIRGHEMAKAAVENALWDVESRINGTSLSALLGGEAKEVSCGVSLGIEADPAKLLANVQREVAAGYQRIKLKIKPGNDVATVQCVRSEFPDLNLTVDANSAYRLDHVDHLRLLDEHKLTMIEQPLAWDDIYAHSCLQRQLQTPICLDESIHNVLQASAAIEMGACRVINVKLGRVGGHSEAKKIEELCRKRSFPLWCGGMLESGIGRAHNVAMSSLPGFVLPGDVSASSRYWEEDIIEPEVQVGPQGTIVVPGSPGLGYAIKTKFVEQLTVNQKTWPNSKTLTVLNEA